MTKLYLKAETDEVFKALLPILKSPYKLKKFRLGTFMCALTPEQFMHELGSEGIELRTEEL